jgi:ABC transporter substrate binding protein
MGRKSTIGKLKPVLSRSFPFDRAQDERLSSWIVTYPGPFVVSQSNHGMGFFAWSGAARRFENRLTLDSRQETAVWCTIPMIKKTLALCVVALILASVRLADAQQPGKVHRIGFLRASVPPESYIEGFRHGLQKVGYIEGKNIIIEYRLAEGKSDRLPELAVELVRLKVDVIVASGTNPMQASKDATSMIPIVIASAGDPVREGLITRLARPGGNITGVTNLSAELGGKTAGATQGDRSENHPKWDCQYQKVK